MEPEAVNLVRGDLVLVALGLGGRSARAANDELVLVGCLLAGKLDALGLVVFVRVVAYLEASIVFVLVFFFVFFIFIILIFVFFLLLLPILPVCLCMSYYYPDFLSNM